MRLGKELIGNPIYSVIDGRHLGSVKDLYLDLDLKVVNGVYLGSEGLISRKALLIQREDISVYGVDALLVKGPDVVVDSDAMPSVKGWLRREELQGRNVDTAGGTKVGTVGDVLLSDEGEIVGYFLSKVHVSGPVDEHRQVLNQAVLDTGSEDGSMTIDLSKAERPSEEPEEDVQEVELPVEEPANEEVIETPIEPATSPVEEAMEEIGEEAGEEEE